MLKAIKALDRKAQFRLFMVIAALAILLTVVLIYSAASSVPKEIALPVAVEKAGYTNLEQSISVTGEMRPNQQIDLHSKVAGYLQSIKVDIGDHVKEGSVIAVLEIPELREERESGQAATAAAEQSVKSAQAKYNETHSALQRLQEVSKKNPKLIAQQDVDNATGRDQSAAADVAESQQRVAECKANQDKIDTMLNYATITAPFDGVITKRYADPGSLIQAGISSNTQSMPVVSLAQDTLLRATFPLPESVVANLKTGDAVSIVIPALNKTVQGTISRFSRQVERATRTMEAQVDIPNADRAITAGMYAVANFSLENKKNVLTIPIQALKPGENPTVFIVNEKLEVEKRQVVPGMQTPDRVEIKSGLKNKDLVIIGNTNELRPGMHVTVDTKVAEVPLAKNKNHG
ncbi:MAG: efflux RND transporter periplasmic adaptor subunit [Chthoniobacterales bacterium]